MEKSEKILKQLFEINFGKKIRKNIVEKKCLKKYFGNKFHKKNVEKKIWKKLEIKFYIFYIFLCNKFFQIVLWNFFLNFIL